VRRAELEQDVPVIQIGQLPHLLVDQSRGELLDRVPAQVRARVHARPGWGKYMHRDIFRFYIHHTPTPMLAMTVASSSSKLLDTVIPISSWFNLQSIIVALKSHPPSLRGSVQVCTLHCTRKGISFIMVAFLLPVRLLFS